MKSLIIHQTSVPKILTAHSNIYAGIDGHIYVARILSSTNSHIEIGFKKKSEFQCNPADRYLWVRIGKDIRMQVHKIICESYHGKRNDNYGITHIDGSFRNNKPENLEWYFRKTLYDFLTAEEFSLWEKKLNSMDATRWENFNNDTLKEIIRRGIPMKDETGRKEFFEERFKCR